MYPIMQQELARQNAIEAQRTGAGRRLAREASEAAREERHGHDVVIREAEAADVLAMMRLGDLDSKAVPGGRLLVAEVHGRVQAALALDGGQVLADPFEPTSHLVALLQLRAAQLGVVRAHRGLFGAPAPRFGRTA
jgi:hypothetical protein